jgi:hypothetical protein
VVCVPAVAAGLVQCSIPSCHCNPRQGNPPRGRQCQDRRRELSLKVGAASASQALLPVPAALPATPCLQLASYSASGSSVASPAPAGHLCAAVSLLHVPCRTFTWLRVMNTFCSLSEQLPLSARTPLSRLALMAPPHSWAVLAVNTQLLTVTWLTSKTCVGGRWGEGLCECAVLWVIACAGCRAWGWCMVLLLGCGAASWASCCSLMLPALRCCAPVHLQVPSKRQGSDACCWCPEHTLWRALQRGTPAASRGTRLSAPAVPAPALPVFAAAAGRSAC